MMRKIGGSSQNKPIKAPNSPDHCDNLWNELRDAPTHPWGRHAGRNYRHDDHLRDGCASRSITVTAWAWTLWKSWEIVVSKSKFSENSFHRGRPCNLFFPIFFFDIDRLVNAAEFYTRWYTGKIFFSKIDFLPTPPLNDRRKKCSFWAFFGLFSAFLQYWAEKSQKLHFFEHSSP